MPGMICSQCGKEHQNAKGKCPFCTPKRALSNRQKQRPSETDVIYTAECPDCGQKIESLRWVKMPSGRIWPVPELIHNCPKTASK